MAFRNIFISSPAKLSIKNSQLIIKAAEEYSFPLEDVSSILIESGQASITSALMAYCGRNGVLIYLCDSKHLPCAVLTGLNTHSRKYKMLQAQTELKLTVKKHLWQSIVKKKIENQAQVLKLVGKDYTEIQALSKKVKLNDEDNMEAVAAAAYFRNLFDNGFSRAQDDIINARLNYGYSIVRGYICRCLVVYGLEPALGIHHKSQLNAFNLADDIIEIFRPVVDLCVRQMEDTDEDTLSTRDKQILYNLLNCDVVFKKQKHPLSYAIEKTVQTLQACYLNNRDMLEMRDIIPLTQHEYE